MSSPNAFIPKLDQQPPTVDFIENRLPKYHPAFVNPPVRFDPMSGQYVPKNQALVPRLEDDHHVMLGIPEAVLDDDGIPPRPAYDNLAAMEFWKSIIPEAIDEFRATNEPKGRAETDFNIRNTRDWDEICDILESARTRYNDKEGPRGIWLKTRRKFADKSTPVGELAKMASKIVPSDPYATPVLGVVVILLEAAKTAAGVRQRVLQGFDGLLDIVSDVELFLGSFQGDLNIRKASVDLTATILKAIEQAIGFFIRNELAKGAKALFQGNNYEKDLLESLEKIQEKSKCLMAEANKSHIHKFRIFSEGARKHNKLQLQGIQAILSTQELLIDLVRQCDHARQEFLQRAASPIQLTLISTPPPQIQAPLTEWFIHQNSLRRILDTFDLDLRDIDFITEKRNQFLAKQLALSEQIVRTHLFRNWVISPVPAKLLVQWDFRLPKIVAGISPLSVVCTSIVQALRMKEQFMSALWFCGRHVDQDEPAKQVGGHAMLASLIDQLLRQHTFDTRPLHQVVDPSALHEKSLDTLLQLLAWLVSQLPPTTTLFFIIDGVVQFERDDLEGEALQVFAWLLKLTTADPSILANVKVLFTSTPGTETVRSAFEEEDLILNVHTLPQLGLVPNDERVAMELEGGFAF